MSFISNWFLPKWENSDPNVRIKAIGRINDLDILIMIFIKENEEACKLEIITRFKYLIKQLNLNELNKVYNRSWNSTLIKEETCKREIISSYKSLLMKLNLIELKKVYNDNVNSLLINYIKESIVNEIISLSNKNYREHLALIDYFLKQFNLNEFNKLYNETESSIFKNYIKKRIIDLKANMSPRVYKEFTEKRITEILKINDLSELIKISENEFDPCCKNQAKQKINEIIYQIEDINELIRISKISNDFYVENIVHRLSDMIITLNNTPETKNEIENLLCDTPLLRIVFEHQDEELRSFAKSVFIEQLKKQPEIEQKTIKLLLNLKIQNHTQFENRRGKKIEQITLREAVILIKNYNWNQINSNDKFLFYRYDRMDKFDSTSCIFRAKDWQFMTLKGGSYG